jgi:hypothetical protein
MIPRYQVSTSNASPPPSTSLEGPLLTSPEPAATPRKTSGTPRAKRSLDLILALVAAYLLLSPSGPLGSRISNWRRNRNTIAYTNRHWAYVTDGTSSLGSPSDPIVAIEVLDYECDYCRASATALDTAIARTSVRVAILVAKRGRGARSDWAARVAGCSASQGAFPVVHRYLISQTDWLSDTNTTRLWEMIGSSAATHLKSCLTTIAASARISRDSVRIASLNPLGTPVLLNRRKLLIGRFSAEEALSVLR